MGGDFRAEKLRVNLRLVINRLKLLEKKKTELTQKARKDIADYLSSGKDERARIRVEHIIREDYLVEAMEILELFCDLLLARFGLVQSMKDLDPGLQEAVSTLIWAAPRLQSEVSELKIVSDQLCSKYSKEFGRLCRTNQLGTVNDRLMHKLSVEAPPKVLVENYLVEIAKNYNVSYEPDESDLGALPQVCTCEVKDLIDVGTTAEERGGGGGGALTTHAPMLMPTSVPTAFNYPAPRGAAEAVVTSNNFQAPVRGGGGGLPSQLPSCPPTYGSALGTTGPSARLYDDDGLPELPSVPDTLPAGMSSFGGTDSVSTNSSSDDIDFDDLARRFEALKNNM